MINKKIRVLLFVLIVFIILIVVLFLFFNYKNLFCEKVNLRVFYSQYGTGIFYSEKEDSHYNANVCLDKEFSFRYNGIDYNIVETLDGVYMILKENNNYYLVKPSHMWEIKPGVVFSYQGDSQENNKILLNRTISLGGSKVTDSFTSINITRINL
jgi:hypothetical protein